MLIAPDIRNVSDPPESCERMVSINWWNEQTYAFVDASPEIQVLPGTVRLPGCVVLHSFDTRLVIDPKLRGKGHDELAKCVRLRIRLINEIGSNFVDQV